jgi:hypothetical protein
LAIAVVLVAASCGRIGFDASSDGLVGDGPPPTAVPGLPGMVEATGVASAMYEADGTHLVFVDSTPGRNGDLIVVREGDNDAVLRLYVSPDHGATWRLDALSPSGAGGINVLGACQNTVDHALHVGWVDSGPGDQSVRLVPAYSGGDITAMAITTIFGFYNDLSDTPGPRDFAEIVDATGHHRLMFAGTGPPAGSTGRLKLAVTTDAAGIVPASQNDWANATDQTKTGQDDQLLANSYPTADGPTTYMVATASNRTGGPSAVAIVVGGFPADRKLLAWTLTPLTSDNFVVSAPIMLSTAFGGGSGLRADASLSVVTTPAGEILVLYNDEPGSLAPGLHVAAFATTGALTADRYPQPSTSVAARHAVIDVSTTSRPAVLYGDGAGRVMATLLWGGAWLPAVQIASASITGAWGVTDPWQPGGQDAFGAYVDTGVTSPTLFVSVAWR